MSIEDLEDLDGLLTNDKISQHDVKIWNNFIAYCCCFAITHACVIIVFKRKSFHLDLNFYIGWCRVSLLVLSIRRITWNDFCLRAVHILLVFIFINIESSFENLWRQKRFIVWDVVNASVRCILFNRFTVPTSCLAMLFTGGVCWWGWSRSDVDVAVLLLLSVRFGIHQCC